MRYCLILLVLGLAIFPMLKRDDAGYAQLLKSSEPQKARALCQQFREGVSKKMWTDKRQYCSIESDTSELFFFTEKGEVEVVEELDAVTCLLQERLFEKGGEKMQTVRLLKANEASLNYNTQIFTANDVLMWTYEVPGHEVPISLESFEPILEGKAKQITLHLEGKEFDLSAYHFEGQMK